MPIRTETHIAMAGAAVAQLPAFLPEFLPVEYALTTLLPSFVGAGIHTVNRARRDELRVADLLTAWITAFFVGAWGGPWMAEMVPQSELALPFACYAFSLYAKQIGDALVTSIIGMARNAFGSKSKAD